MTRLPPLPALPALSAESRATFWHSLQTFTVTRILIALVLLVYLSVDGRYGRARVSYGETCIAYLVAALLFAALTYYWRRRFVLQLGCQILTDLGAISLLYLAGGGVRSGFGLLYLFPLAGAAILAPLVLALFSAALATLFVLGEALSHLLALEDEPALMQAGISGAAFFALVLVVSRLAARLIGQQELAARRGADLRVQQAIYRIVVDDVDDGILVLGRDGLLFGANPAARRMLGLDAAAGDEGDGPPALRLADAPALEAVAHSFEAWVAGCADAATAAVLAAPAAYVTIKR